MAWSNIFLYLLVGPKSIKALGESDVGGKFKDLIEINSLSFRIGDALGSGDGSKEEGKGQKGSGDGSQKGTAVPQVETLAPESLSRTHLPLVLDQIAGSMTSSRFGSPSIHPARLARSQPDSKANLSPSLKAGKKADLGNLNFTKNYDTSSSWLLYALNKGAEDVISLKFSILGRGKTPTGGGIEILEIEFKNAYVESISLKTVQRDSGIAVEESVVVVYSGITFVYAKRDGTKAPFSWSHAQ